MILPGRGYGAQGPVLAYPRLALEQAGISSLVVRYSEAGEGGADEVVADVVRQIDASLMEHQPDGVVIVAKSLGTSILTKLPVATVEAFPAVKAVWITPLFGDDGVRQGAIDLGWESLLIAGTADPYFDAVGHSEVEEALGARSVVLPGADHSLHVQDDVLATIDAHKSLAGEVLRFVAD